MDYINLSISSFVCILLTSIIISILAKRKLITKFAIVILVTGVIMTWIGFILAKNEASLLNAFISDAVILPIFFLLINFLHRAVSKPINTIADIAHKVSMGQLNVDLSDLKAIKKRGNEIGELAESFFTMVINFRTMAKRIEDAASSVDAGANEIAAASDQISKGAQKQASAADETSASMEQMSVNIKDVAKNADGLASNVTETTCSIQELGITAQGVAKNSEEMAVNVNQTSASMDKMISIISNIAQSLDSAEQLSQKASKEAEAGGSAIIAAVDGVKKIGLKMDNIADSVRNLGQRSEAIGNIIEVIEDIADQTNLLALNAAIEAARAGDAGKGFSVVADEVRRLAERSIQATKDIGEVIKHVQGETIIAVKIAEEGAEEAREGVSLSDQAGEAIKKIMGSVSSTSSIMRDISVATLEQEKSIKDVSESVESMSSLTNSVAQAVKEQAYGVEQIIKAAEEMSLMTEQVKNSTIEQKQGGSNVVKAIENISDIAKSNLVAVQQLTRLSQGLSYQSQGLQDILKQFTLDNASKVQEWDEDLQVKQVEDKILGVSNESGESFSKTCDLNATPPLL